MPFTLLDGILIFVMLDLRGARHDPRLHARGLLDRLLGRGRRRRLFLLGRRAALCAALHRGHNLALGVTIAGIFFITLLIVSLITMRISDFVLDSRPGRSTARSASSSVRRAV